LFPFYIVSCFTRKKIININKFIVKCERKKILSEGNQIHNFISSSGSGTVINYGFGFDFLTSYGSGSTRQKVTVPTVPVPVPQHCSEGLFICKKLCKCTVPSKSNKKKNCAKKVVGVLMVKNENSRIRIH
jgi:hypothetical protein